MLKIFNAEQIRRCDAFTIQHEPVASIDLMERACRAFTAWFTARFTITQKVTVVCGPGNNGGDGLGIARMLTEWGFPVRVWIVDGDTKRSSDFTTNLERLPGKSKLVDGVPEDSDIIIDAIFGSGLSRPVTGAHQMAISAINACGAIVVSVDIPSGLFADKSSTGHIVEADHTVTFQFPKLAFMMPENYKYAGEWNTVEIGLSKQFIAGEAAEHLLVTRKGAKGLVQPRSKFDHKGDNGRGLLIAGSYGKMGACVLAARAALRSGIGLLTLHVPPVGYNIVQASVPEAMVSLDKDQNFFTGTDALDSFDVIGVGPGIGRDPHTAKGLREVLERGKPMVIDADALNILSEKKEWLRSIPTGSILTPHPKEFQRLSTAWSDDFDRLEKQKKLASETGAVVVLKGAHSSVSVPGGNTYFNSTGNPGMATGGSGDVLTGVLTGLLAQGYAAAEAAILGVFLHGLAGDIACNEKGINSMIASDLIDEIPAAFRKIMG